MNMFTSHKIIENKDGDILILYLNPMLEEFAKQAGANIEPKTKETIKKSAEEYIKSKLADNKIRIAKVMMGPVLITTLTFGAPIIESMPGGPNTVQAAQIKDRASKIYINGKEHTFSRPAVIIGGTTYVPIREIAEALGGEVWWNGESSTVGINKDNKKIAFVVGANIARVNGNAISMKPSYIDNGRTMVPLRFVSEALGMSVSWNGKTKEISISQPKPGSTTPTPQTNTTTYDSYTIQSGDNMWDLSIRFGIPMYELLQANNMTENSPLSVGQKISVPVHHIPVKSTVSEKHGEHLDWWTEAQYVFSIGKTATVVDFQTGRSFQIKRTIGANHADCEPLTANDAKVIKEVWGGAYSWKERAVIVHVDGRKIAASMSSMPHDIQYISGNNFDGHFDLHFKNSTRHSDGKVSPAHQTQIQIAAGVS